MIFEYIKSLLKKEEVKIEDIGNLYEYEICYDRPKTPRISTERLKKYIESKGWYMAYEKKVKGCDYISQYYVHPYNQSSFIPLTKDNGKYSIVAPPDFSHVIDKIVREENIPRQEVMENIVEVENVECE